MATKYQILRMERPGTPPFLRNGRPWLFDDPAEAARVAKQVQVAYHEKACVKPVIDEEWREREEVRFGNGTYRQLPWYADRWWLSDAAYAIWRNHYAHASLEKPGWIAFTKSEEDGTKDKQTLLRPGAYLNRYFEKVLADYGLHSERLSEQFMKMYGPIDVKFATTDNEVAKVYDYLNTCMSDKAWPKGIHPATVYLAGDLQVAYIGDIDAGRIAARTLVWPAKKLHSRVYGDIARLTQGLDRLGYKWGAPIGAKLKRIQLRPAEFKNGDAPQGCFLLPYIDKRNQAGGGHLGVKDMGDHLVVCAENEPGSHHAGQADGRSGRYVPRADEYPTFSCDHCENEGFRHVTEVRIQDPDEGDDSEIWCDDCLDDAFQCGYSGFYFSNEVAMETVNHGPWAKTFADMYARRCEGNGLLYIKNDLLPVYLDGADTPKYLSNDYRRENFPGGVMLSDFSCKYFPKMEGAVVYTGTWGDRINCSKSELKRHAFQCDKCGSHWALEDRHQPFGDDKLYCPKCLPQEQQKPKQQTAQFPNPNAMGINTFYYKVQGI